MVMDVEEKIRKKNKILFSRESVSLQPLLAAIRSNNHQVIVLWALDCAQSTLLQLESMELEERRPRQCLELSRAWAEGRVKMGAAKKAILDCHQAAKALDPIPAALCHAIGHAGASVHVETHAIGLPMYELTALVLAMDGVNFEAKVSEKIAFYEERLAYWSRQTNLSERSWAAFLCKDRPNREQLRWEKKHRDGVPPELKPSQQRQVSNNKQQQ